MLIQPFDQVVTVGDAVAVGDDQGGAIVCIRLKESSQGLLVAGAHSYAGYIDVTISHGDHSQVFLR